MWQLDRETSSCYISEANVEATKSNLHFKSKLPVTCIFVVAIETLQYSSVNSPKSLGTDWEKSGH